MNPSPNPPPKLQTPFMLAEPTMLVPATEKLTATFVVTLVEFVKYVGMEPNNSHAPVRLAALLAGETGGEVVDGFDVPENEQPETVAERSARNKQLNQPLRGNMLKILARYFFAKKKTGIAAGLSIRAMRCQFRTGPTATGCKHRDGTALRRASRRFPATAGSGRPKPASGLRSEP